MYCNVSLSTAFCGKNIPTNKIKVLKNIEKGAESLYTSPFAPSGITIDVQKAVTSSLDKQAMNTRIPLNVLEEQARQEAKIAAEKAAKLAEEEAKNAYPTVPFN